VAAPCGQGRIKFLKEGEINMSCPICGAALKVLGDLSEDGAESCPNGHFGYEHSYGSHREHYDVDGSEHLILTQAWHYNEEESLRRLRENTTRLFVEYARAVNKERNEKESRYLR
jgi:hypothetical protein